MRGIASACLLLMTAVTGVDVVGRLMGHPLFGSEEIVTFLAVCIVAMSLPYAHTEHSHIGVEIFVRYMPKRIRHGLKLARSLTALVLFGIVTWRMTDYAVTMSESGTVSMNLELPEYYVVYVLAFGFLIFSLHLLRDVIEFFSNGTTEE